MKEKANFPAIAAAGRVLLSGMKVECLVCY